MNWETTTPKEFASLPSAAGQTRTATNGRGEAWRTVDVEGLEQALGRLECPLVVEAADVGAWRVRDGAAGTLAEGAAFVPACLVENLGDATFCREHGLRYAYVAGAMANGIGSVEIVKAMGRAGMLGFFGSAGLPLRQVEKAIDRLQDREQGTGDREQGAAAASVPCSLSPVPYGFNLIHSPSEPNLEAGVVDLYVRRGVRLVEASAFLDLTLPVVRYRVQGLHQDGTGRIVAPNKIIAKVSRIEVAEKFLSPPPEALLRQLQQRGELTAEQVEWAKRLPMAQDITAEADSAGHTDNRPALTLLPTLLALRNRVQPRYGADVALRIGAAGGISTPSAAAAAFAMGAAYVLTGSVNQACVESGTSDTVRQLLAEAEQADVMMAPAADMFEMGVRLQVLKRGTMFAMRAAKLYEIYRTCQSIEEIPAAQRQQLEKTVFRMSLDDVWRQTCEFFEQRDPAQLARAETDGRHKMALVFRWYLGLSSHWANQGTADRKIDYQIWCGPAMGAFNEWVRGSFLEQAHNRRVATVALNIMHGAAVLTRGQMLRLQGVALPADVPRLVPRVLEELS